MEVVEQKKLKLAVIKCGSRVMNGATSGGAGEAYALSTMLLKGGCDVHIFTKILKKDPPAPEFTWHQVLEDAEKINTFGFDALIVVNSAVNYIH